MRLLAAALVLLMAGCLSVQDTATAPSTPVLKWTASVKSESVATDADDPAIWVHPTDPSMSLIIGTNKSAAPDGAVVVFDLNGRILQSIAGVDRPNNVDTRLNTVVVTERRKSAVRIFEIDPASRKLTQKASFPVFAGQTGDEAAPMGIALYRRPSDGALFVILSRKSGPSGAYLWQYEVTDCASLKFVRAFGQFSGNGEIEAVVVDDELGYVYYADEGAGIRKYQADPAHPDAAKELALFGREGYRGDREGLALYTSAHGKGFLISTDQMPGASRYMLFRREGSPGNPHDHAVPVAIIEGGADSTDGIDATSAPLGPAWPRGLLVAMNSGPKNFLFFPWQLTGEPSGTP